MKTKLLLVISLALLSAWTRSSAADAPKAAAETPSAPATAVECRPRGGLPNFFAKLKNSAEVRIAYLGGSITAQEGWRPKTLKWCQEQFPNAKVSQINAAIGGTGSDLGVFRLRQDVLAHRPDLLFVEFAVNDGGAPPEQIHRCMEGIVRQTWRHDPQTDICFVYTLAGNMLETYQRGDIPRSVKAMEQLAAHYGIPGINFGLEVARLEKEGKLVFKAQQPKTDADKAALAGKILFSPDGVHPFPDSGHQLYLEAVVRGMKQIQGTGQAGPRQLPPPFTPDNYEAAKLVPLSQAGLSRGWTKLDPATNSLARSFQNQMPEMWSATRPGETVTFQFKGAAVGIYDLLTPDSGQVTIQLDDQAPRVRPRFDAYSTYARLGTLMIATGLSNTVHRVKIEIHPEPPDKQKILSQRSETMDDPKRFEGAAWHAGALMLMGELVE